MKGHCKIAENILLKLVSYIGNENGLLYEACCSSDEYEIPVLLRFMLFCSILQNTCLFIRNDWEDQTSFSTQIYGNVKGLIRMYGISLVIAD